MPARPVKDVLRWYEEKAASIQHFWLVDVAPKRVEYRAINKDGEIFDVYPSDVIGAEAAEKVYRLSSHATAEGSNSPAQKSESQK